MANREPIFFTRRFLPMWLGQSFGALSDNMNRQVLLIGVPFGAVSLSGFESNDAAVPLIGALFPIAMLLGSMYGGQFAEKFETQMMFRRTKILEILLMLCAGYGLITDQGWFLVFALFGMGLQSSSFNPVRQSAMPKYLNPDELIRGNGLINAGLYACILLGYAIGGYMISIKPDNAPLAKFGFLNEFGITPTAPLLTAIVLVMFSVLGYLTVWLAPKAAATNPDLKIDWSGFIPAFKMARYTFSEESVIRPIIGIALFYLVSTAVTVLLPIYSRDTLGADGTGVTIITFLFGVGAGIGAVIATIISRDNSGLKAATMGISLAAICTAAIYFTSLTFTPNPDGSLMNAQELFSKPQGILLAVLLCLNSIFMGIYLDRCQAFSSRRHLSFQNIALLALP